jgi:hypothetical protein
MYISVIENNFMVAHWTTCSGQTAKTIFGGFTMAPANLVSSPGDI